MHLAFGPCHAFTQGRKAGQNMKTKVLAMMLLAGGSMFAQTRFSVGIGFHQAAPVYASNIPPCPGPGYTWVDGYWSQNYGRPVWVAGFWNAPVVTTGFGFGPRTDDGFRGDFDRDRGFDRDRNFNGHEQGRNFNPGAARGHSDGHDNRGNDNRGNGNGNGFRGR